MANEDEDLNKLFYPELMSTEELKTMLIKRCVLSPANACDTREQLINLFNRVVMPLEQRTHKDTAREKLMYNSHSPLNGIKRTVVDNRSSNTTNLAKLSIQESKKIKTEDMQLNNKGIKRALPSCTENSVAHKKVKQKICWP